MHVAAIIAAGGRGQRLAAGVPKQLLPLGRLTILERSVAAFVASDRIDEIVVVLPEELAANPPSYLRVAGKPLRILAGGARRQDSVAIGFDAVSRSADVVVVHDAARPFVNPGLIARTIDAAVESGAAIPAIASRDTVKEVRPDGGTGRAVERTLPRGALVLVQTPQAFRTAVLAEGIALGRRGVEATDEASLVEQAGHEVRLVDGDPRNIKITMPEDLALARGVMAVDEGDGTGPAVRVGTGYDLHRLAHGRPLVLGGVTIPFALGLDGHSDADALCHAVSDAILGAAAAGDIGRHFPDTDERWKGASSLDLLKRAVGLVRERGFAVVNVDAVVIAERPRLAPYHDEIVARLAATLGVPPSAVSVKGKTSEGVGEIGHGEAIAVHAVALLRSLQWPVDSG
jgi:2-C-methyl-D-erythritol 4-phosphate cytidylyltransferase/2-C-methyl-D-erythritol 2,4-cyclodiphosphate synthase